MENKKEKNEAIEHAIKDLNKKYGVGTIMKLDETNKIEIESIPTGCYSLDYVFGCGGLPKKRITEMFGEAGTGKSTLSMHLAAEVQKQGGKVLLVDVEYAFDSNYAQKIGVDIKSLILSQPNNAEEAMDIIDNMIRSNGVDLIILDSVAGLVPKKELEGEIGDQDIALIARLLSKALRVITGNISKSKTSMLFINQTRSNIGAFSWGLKNISSGGKALKFYSSVRLEVKGGKKIKNSNGDVIGNEMNIVSVKNKTAMPWRTAKLDIIFGEGIDVVADIFDIGVTKKIISKSGNTFNFEKETFGVGREKSIIFLKEHKEILDKIKKELNKLDN